MEVLEPRILYSADGLLGVFAEPSYPDFPTLLDAELSLDALADVEQPEALSPTLILPDAALPDAATSALAFVDTNVLASERLVGQLEQQGIEVVEIRHGEDGLARIGDTLSGREDVSAVLVFSHGSQDHLQLGSVTLTAESLSTRVESLGSWSDALAADGDILLYACDLAGGEAGSALVREIAQITRADVAASTNTSGGAALGGDWVLEAATGPIDASIVDLAPLDDYPATLASILVTTTDDIVDAPDLTTLAALNADKGADGGVSLREAIIVAGNDASVDLVTLPSGTYQLTIAGDEDAGLAGDLDLQGNVSIQGAGSGTTIIEQTTSDRVFQLASGTLSIDNVTITGGDASAQGGAFHVEAGSMLSVSHAVVTANQSAGDGGAIWSAGDVTLGNIQVDSNVAGNSGGAVYLETTGALTVTDALLDGNSATGAGGAVWSDGGVALARLTISNNVSGSTGGAHFISITRARCPSAMRRLLQIRQSMPAVPSGVTVRYRFTAVPSIPTVRSDRGGALHIAAGSDLQVDDTSFANNSASLDGGAVWTDGTTTMVNVALSSNQSSNSGGAMYADANAVVALGRVSVTSNIASQDGAGPLPERRDGCGRPAHQRQSGDSRWRWCVRRQCRCDARPCNDCRQHSRC